jgi:preprotein translocase subunit SecA
MRTDTGEIITADEARVLNQTRPGLEIPMKLPPTLMQKRQKKVGRNDPCPCGSGKKFKRCHLLWRPS